MTQATASTRMRASGDAVIRGILSYEWDNHSRLKKVTWGAGKSTEFKYKIDQIIDFDGGCLDTDIAGSKCNQCESVAQSAEGAIF